MTTGEHIESMDESTLALAPTRRQWLGILGGLGISSAVFQRALAAQVEQAEAQQATTVTAEMIQQAEWISGLKLSDADRRSLAGSMTQTLASFRRMRNVAMKAHEIPPALSFNPAPWLPAVANVSHKPVEPISQAAPKKPDSAEELAFSPVSTLAALIRTKQISSTELTKLYLERLKKYDPALLCVITLTEELALKQAEAADREIAAGKYRGPLHGIPWGAKDLIAYPGYKTTWGGTPYKDQVLDTKATVAQRLDEAGAVLVAKLSLGALAQGDRWFGNMTRNPWNQQQGSSGSSAGSACAAAAGLVGFAIGTETMGSIISPCTRCGATGLRPTFGRISRAGCMTLSWTMDKLGPICRSVEDTALVLAAVHGADGLDPSAVDRPFAWPPTRDLKSLRVGYFEGGGRGRGRGQGQPQDAAERPEMKVLRDMGVQLVPLPGLPTTHQVPSQVILNAEAATSFDEVPRKNITEGLNTWPGSFRQGEFIPAVEYIRANRLRTLLMQDMEKMMENVDLYVHPNIDMQITNLTGHPTVVMPNGFQRQGGQGRGQAKGQPQQEVPETPTSITFTGRLYGETELLSVALAFQNATKHHLRHPPMDKLKPLNAGA